VHETTVLDQFQDPGFGDRGVRQSVADKTETLQSEAKTEMSTGLETKPEALGDIWQNLHC